MLFRHWGYTPKKESFNNENGSKEAQFAKALLAMDSDTTSSFQELIAGLEILTDNEFEEFEVFLDGNIEIFHYNIYGHEYALKYHLKQAIELLELQPLEKRSLQLVETLKEYETINA